MKRCCLCAAVLGASDERQEPELHDAVRVDLPAIDAVEEALASRHRVAELSLLADGGAID